MIARPDLIERMEMRQKLLKRGLGDMANILRRLAAL